MATFRWGMAAAERFGLARRLYCAVVGSARLNGKIAASRSRGTPKENCHGLPSPIRSGTGSAALLAVTEAYGDVATVAVEII